MCFVYLHPSNPFPPLFFLVIYCKRLGLLRLGVSIHNNNNNNNFSVYFCSSSVSTFFFFYFYSSSLSTFVFILLLYSHLLPYFSSSPLSTGVFFVVVCLFVLFCFIFQVYFYSSSLSEDHSPAHFEKKKNLQGVDYHLLGGQGRKISIIN